MYFDFEDDSNWMEIARGILRNEATNTQLDQRLLSASAQKETSQNNENTKKALTTLAHLGLVVQKSQAHVEDEHSIAQYIASTLLNYSVNNNKPCPVNFCLKIDDISITIPPKSRLLLYRLSQSLKINIFLFSSRAKVTIYKAESSIASVGFFHNIDSYFQTSEYLVLVPSRGPLPDRGLKAPSIAPFHSNIPPAVYRHEKRSSQVEKRKINQDELEECCDRTLKKVW
jgi:hypothetical protein